MTLKICTQPAMETISLTDAKQHLRVDGDDDDVLILSYIKAARIYCEGYQNRAYCTQTWELWLDSFPRTNILEIPLPPLQSITSIKYFDTANEEATFPAASYFVDIKSSPGRVCLNSGYSWPSVALRAINGVCVTFEAGYGGTEAVPQSVKQAMLLLIGHWYENRETVNVVNITKELEFTVGALLWMDRIL